MYEKLNEKNRRVLLIKKIIVILYKIKYMKNNSREIDVNFSYKAKLNCQSIDTYQNAINAHNEFINKIVESNTDYILVDTNVLLRYYEIARTDREELLDFFNKNKAKIYIPYKVQIEFLRNRESVIKNFAKNITTNIIESLDADIIIHLETYIKTYKNVLVEFADLGLEETIEGQIKAIKQLKSQLDEPIKKRKQDYTDIIHNDEFLTTLVSCQKLPSLSENELKVIKDDFDCLKEKEKIESKNVLDFIKKSSEKVFPGIGDIKEKPENPYGDFIIYHELLKFMSDKSADCLFLTFDTTKGDWMKMTKYAHTHYIVNAYENTNKTLCIHDAEKYLNEYANKNIVTPIFEEVTEGVDHLELTKERLRSFIKNNRQIKERRQLLEELERKKMLSRYRERLESLEDSMRGYKFDESINNEPLWTEKANPLKAWQREVVVGEDLDEDNFWNKESRSDMVDYEKLYREFVDKTNDKRED